MIENKPDTVFSIENDSEVKTEKKKNNTVRKILRVLAKIGISFLCFLICFAVAFFGTTAVICYGPSDSVRGLFVTTVMETSAAKFLAQMYLSDEEIEKILAENTAVETEETTNTDLVDVNTSANTEQKDIEVVDVKGSTFEGKMMIVKDPTRIKLATLSGFGEQVRGKKVEEFITANNAVAGINAGGFADENGVGSGGLPLGYVIKDGKILYNQGGDRSIVGFNAEGKLIVGRMTAREAVDMGVLDACTFGPALIVNGERSEISGTGSGLNPRTCVGQRADGSVLLLVIDGRQAYSIGASYEDCIDVMEQFGAVNAGNLDGGSSTVMYLNGELLNKCASVYGPRRLPTAFVVI